jgi:hypothetical protein
MADKDRDHGEDRIEIPQSARDVKAEFWKREDADGVVKEITEWIKGGGEPFMGRGHTLTKLRAAAPSTSTTFVFQRTE